MPRKIYSNKRQHKMSFFICTKNFVLSCHRNIVKSQEKLKVVFTLSDCERESDIIENGFRYFLFDVYTKRLAMLLLHGAKWVFRATKKASLSHSYLRSRGVNAPKGPIYVFCTCECRKRLHTSSVAMGDANGKRSV